MSREGVSRRRIAITTGCLGVVGCLAVLARSPHLELLDPLTLLLGACAVVASLVVVDLESTLFTDASFVPYLLAAAYRGPAAAIAIALTAELVTWLVGRYRKEAAVINAFATAAPNGLAAWAIATVDPSDSVLFLGTVALAGTLALALNALLVIALIGLLDGRPVRMSVRTWPTVLAPFGLNMLLALTAAQAYRDLGIGATAVVLALVWVFNYLIAHILLARARADRITALAESRSRLVHDLLDAEEREKRRLSQALHDGPIQQLMIARQDLAEVAVHRSSALRRVDQLLAKTADQLRSVMFDLYPRLLKEGGLGPALAALARQEARRGELELGLELRSELAEVHDRILFSIARELLRNVIQHAAAEKVEIALVDRDGAVAMRVVDNGRGFSAGPDSGTAPNVHYGLASIEERVRALGGRVKVQSSPSRGTSVEVELPVPLPASPRPAAEIVTGSA